MKRKQTKQDRRSSRATDFEGKKAPRGVTLTRTKSLLNAALDYWLIKIKNGKSYSALAPQIRRDSAAYLEQVFNPQELRVIVKRACHRLRGVEFDALVFCGLSGTLVGCPMSMMLKKSMIVMRKDGGHNHSSLTIEGFLRQDTRYVIVDDIIASGNTVNALYRSLKDLAVIGGFVYTPVAVLLYRGVDDTYLRDLSSPGVDSLNVPVWGLDKYGESC